MCDKCPFDEQFRSKSCNFIVNINVEGTMQNIIQVKINNLNIGDPKINNLNIGDPKINNRVLTLYWHL